jgi:hypothetical protein
MSFFVGLPFELRDTGNGSVERTLDSLELAGATTAIALAYEPNGTLFSPNDGFYAFTRLKPARSSTVRPDDDPLGAICEAARRRGMDVYAHVLAYECAWPGYWPATTGPDISARLLRNFTACAQIDIFGRKQFRVCTNHPDYRQFHLSLVEDLLRTYPVAGIKFNVERNGPLSSVLVGNYAADFGYRKPQAPACFCPHCLEQARSRGVDIERARRGWLELLEFSERSWRAARSHGDQFAGAGAQLGEGRAETPPADGYFIAFLRIIMHYPEILQWNTMWYDSLKSLYAELYGVVKLVSPERKLGLHIWHHRAFSIFERAMYDYAELKRCADWIKPKMDHTVAGFRYHQDLRRYHQALFADRAFEQMFAAWSTLLGWEHEPPPDQLPAAGMSLNYIRRDTESAVRAVEDEIPIYPGIGINIPAPTRTTNPEDLHGALWAAYEAGARGVVLARNLAEMRHENLVAAGQTIAAIRAHQRGASQ